MFIHRRRGLMKDLTCFRTKHTHTHSLIHTKFEENKKRKKKADSHVLTITLDMVMLYCMFKVKSIVSITTWFLVILKLCYFMSERGILRGTILTQSRALHLHLNLCNFFFFFLCAIGGGGGR